MRVLLIDAYDSFVYVIKNYFEKLGASVNVVRNDKLSPMDFETDLIVLGPGPGHPMESGYIRIIDTYKDKLPIFGVCLGMQAICEYFGVSVVKANTRKHGKVSLISHDSKGCFKNIPTPLNVTRYHSLIANEEQIVHSDLIITARSTDDNYVMGIRSNNYTIEGVQFHPESICTDCGLEIFSNLLN